MGAYYINRGRTQLWEAPGTVPLPAELREALESPDVLKIAFNAQAFERVIARRVLKLKTPHRGWCRDGAGEHAVSRPPRRHRPASRPAPGQAEVQDGERLVKKFTMPQSTKANLFEW